MESIIYQGVKYRRYPDSKQRGSTMSQVGISGSKGLVDYMRRFGKRIVEIYHKVLISTIKMAIRLTTILRTWSASKEANINDSICENDLKTQSTERTTSSICPKSDRSLMLGERPKRERSGTLNTPLEYYSQNQESLSVLNVIRTALQRVGLGVSSVLGNVVSDGTQESGGKSIQIIGSVTHAKVYNLSVEDCPEYYANGVLVSNCHATVYFRAALDKATAKSGVLLPSRDRIGAEVEYQGGKIVLNDTSADTIQR